MYWTDKKISKFFFNNTYEEIKKLIKKKVFKYSSCKYISLKLAIFNKDLELVKLIMENIDNYAEARNFVARSLVYTSAEVIEYILLFPEFTMKHNSLIMSSILTYSKDDEIIKLLLDDKTWDVSNLQTSECILYYNRSNDKKFSLLASDTRIIDSTNFEDLIIKIFFEKKNVIDRFEKYNLLPHSLLFNTLARILEDTLFSSSFSGLKNMDDRILKLFGAENFKKILLCKPSEYRYISTEELRYLFTDKYLSVFLMKVVLYEILMKCREHSEKRKYYLDILTNILPNVPKEEKEFIVNRFIRSSSYYNFFYDDISHIKILLNDGIVAEYLNVHEYVSRNDLKIKEYVKLVISHPTMVNKNYYLDSSANIVVIKFLIKNNYSFRGVSIDILYDIAIKCLKSFKSVFDRIVISPSNISIVDIENVLVDFFNYHKFDNYNIYKKSFVFRVKPAINYLINYHLKHCDLNLKRFFMNLLNKITPSYLNNNFIFDEILFCSKKINPSINKNEFIIFILRKKKFEEQFAIKLVHMKKFNPKIQKTKILTLAKKRGWNKFSLCLKKLLENTEKE